MKKYLNKIGLSILLAALVSACTPNIPKAESPEAKLYLKTCTQCHSWAHPARHSAEEWNHYVGVMEGHMKKRRIALPEKDKEIILKYLQRYAR